MHAIEIEELRVEARAFAHGVAKICQRFPAAFRFGITAPLMRSAATMYAAVGGGLDAPDDGLRHIADAARSAREIDEFVAAGREFGLVDERVASMVTARAHRVLGGLRKVINRRQRLGRLSEEVADGK